MAERWYQVPAEFSARSADEGGEELEPIMLLFNPLAVRRWPEMKSLPRRLHGRIRKG
jgi:hypothetical protein